MADLRGNTYTLGLAQIEIGDIAPDGGMGTTLDILGYTNKDSCSFTQEEPEVTDFFAEEVDDPVVSISKAGAQTFNFSVMDPDVKTLQKFMGGTVTGTGATAKWEAPASIPTIEKSVKITPQRGLVFSIPRMKLDAKLNGQFSKTNIFVIDVVGKVLVPTKSGEPKLSAVKLPEA